MDNWLSISSVLSQDPDEELVSAMLQHETQHASRIQVIDRLFSRKCKLKNQRERRALYERIGKSD